MVPGGVQATGLAANELAWRDSATTPGLSRLEAVRGLAGAWNSTTSPDSPTLTDALTAPTTADHVA